MKHIKNFPLNAWTVHIFPSSITVRNGKVMVCRCTKNDAGREYAALLRRVPEMYRALKECKEVIWLMLYSPIDRIVLMRAKGAMNRAAKVLNGEIDDEEDVEDRQ